VYYHVIQVCKTRCPVIIPVIVIIIRVKCIMPVSGDSMTRGDIRQVTSHEITIYNTSPEDKVHIQGSD